MKISVVTVCYNNKKGLINTLNSIINQTVKAQIIVIDGGSTDGTRDILEKFNEKLFYWVSEADNGIYDAMNKGLEVARGEWCIFLNSGDVFESPRVLDFCESKFTEKNTLYFGRVRVVNENKKTWCYPSYDISNSNVQNWLKKYEPNHQTIFFPKSFYSHQRYELSYKISSDLDFKLWSMDKCNVEFIDNVVSIFEEGGVSTKPKLKNLLHQYYERHLILKSHDRKSIFLILVIKAFLKYFSYIISPNDHYSLIKKIEAPFLKK